MTVSLSLVFSILKSFQIGKCFEESGKVSGWKEIKETASFWKVGKFMRSGVCTKSYEADFIQ